MKEKELHRITTIAEFHRIRGLQPPAHPLISVVNYADVILSPENNHINWMLDYYSISLKRDVVVKFRYGQQKYDYDEGIMYFIAPGQVFNIEVPVPLGEEQAKRSGWMLLLHPDFFWNTALSKNIKQYEYFGYATNEALFLSEKEEATIINIIQNIRHEYNSNIDKFTQQIIVSHIETLLNYADRFYNRQFITRKITNHQVLEKLEALLASEGLFADGIPSVQLISERLNISPNYLSSLLKNLTGQSTQQHIQNKLINIAKQKLSTTGLSVNEVAYELGFEHPQSFRKFFKAKTNMSPVEFRESFN
ncbi:helix-turn-helix domain-containing protein [Chitinophaga sancti]|uniref:Helix-turn-helix domain-containing protein n=1 Tax=Chitinophaga sancti TaxID=1004 RepID=A0A1K1RQV2_9BACT|nr:helix-turn-helix domain-containing protein [Chitinophaga sancti]WQD62521.1 helix-turn-helix domain-containing protein [Chitinophaga sancti]WQG91910.1 helix-turn-helix domain-containing protein [Chitinophaga sancti]SFW74164.1 Helix-turn-helix domain-containing protein [Chitinophaga sancti]